MKFLSIFFRTFSVLLSFTGTTANEDGNATPTGVALPDETTDGSYELPTTSASRDAARGSSLPSRPPSMASIAKIMPGYSNYTRTLTRTVIPVTPTLNITVITAAPISEIVFPSIISRYHAAVESWKAILTSRASYLASRASYLASRARYLASRASHGGWVDPGASSSSSSYYQSWKATPVTVAIGNTTADIRSSSSITMTTTTATNTSTIVLGSSFLPKGTPSRWGNGWWLHVTTWVTFSPGHDVSSGQTNQTSICEHGQQPLPIAGGIDFMTVVIDSPVAVDSNRLKGLPQEQNPVESASVCVYRLWWLEVRDLSLFVGKSCRLEDHGTVEDFATTVPLPEPVATTPETSKKVMVDDSPTAVDSNPPQEPHPAEMCVYHPPWRVETCDRTPLIVDASGDEGNYIMPTPASVVTTTAPAAKAPPALQAARGSLRRYWNSLNSWWYTPPSSTSSAMRTANRFFVTSMLLWCAGCLYVATRSRLHGGRQLPGTKEDLSYWRRLLAVFTLGMACGGITIIYLSLVVYAALAVWVYRGSREGYFATSCLVALTALYLLPLKVHRTGVPSSRFSHPVLELWRDYFGFSYVFDSTNNCHDCRRSGGARNGRRRNKKVSKGHRRRRRMEERGSTYLLAQMPHGIMPFGSLLGIGILADVMEGVNPMGGVVADALLRAPLLRRAVNWMGVRRASSRSIVQMFADGLKAVGVVTGGIAEMFVSWTNERIVAPRRNFAKIALQGGHHIVLVFVYGVSRTHKMTFASPGLSKKVGFPVMMGHGALLNIPFRETLKMVVSEPIIVNKVANPTDDDIVQLRKRIEAELVVLYYKHLPGWESRPLHLVRGQTSDKELQVLREEALSMLV